MRSEPRADAAVLVGGVGQLYQGDLDIGRRIADQLSHEHLGAGVRVEDLYYGAVTVTHLLRDLTPETLILTGAEPRGRPPATLERRKVGHETRTPEANQAAVAGAITGYVTIDLVIDVARSLDTLPPRVVTVEVEPASIEPSLELTPEVAGVLGELMSRVRVEARRALLFGVADRLRDRLEEAELEPSPALEALHDLLTELRRVEDDTRWGRTFTLRDRLRGHIAAGRLGQGLDHLDWSLWWGLIEELDRLQTVESSY